MVKFIRLKYSILLFLTASCSFTKQLDPNLKLNIDENAVKTFSYSYKLERSEYGISNIISSKEISSGSLSRLYEIEKMVRSKVNKSKFCDSYFIYDRQFKAGYYIFLGECNEVDYKRPLHKNHLVKKR